MNLKLALASTLLIGLATGCGGGNDLDPNTGFTDGKNCPQSLIDAKNQVSSDCADMSSPSIFATEAEIISDAVFCKNSIRAFLDQNPNVFCKAENLSLNEEVYIDSDEMREELNYLESLLN